LISARQLSGRKTSGMSIIYFIPWTIPIAVIGIGNTLAHWFLVQRLRQEFPAAWEQPGSPGRNLFSTSISDGWKEQKAGYHLTLFIWNGRHLALQDSTVSRLVWSARLSYGLIAIFLRLAWSPGRFQFIYEI
jgi:hypothetical protein